MSGPAGSLGGFRPVTLDGVTWRTAVPDDADAIVGLLSDGDDTVFRNKKRLFDWQFFRNPSREGEPCFLVGEAEGRVVAVNGMMPARVLLRGRRTKAIFSCDSFVERRFRRRGLGGRMKEILEAHLPLILSYGIGEAQMRIYRRRGWPVGVEPRKYYLNLREPGLKGRIKNGVSRLLRLWGAGRRLAWGRALVLSLGVSVELPAAEVDALWGRCAKGYVSVVERTAAHLRWKYQDHPWLPYRFVAARSDRGLEGLLVIRHDARESAIVDYCGPARGIEVKAALVGAALRHLLERGCERVVSETTDPEFKSVFWAQGFYRYRGRPTFCVHDKEAAPGEAARHWFLMMGASDTDLLTGIGEEHGAS